MKTIFLISGLKLSQTAADAPLEGLRSMLASKGYQVIPVPIIWNFKTLSTFIDQFVPFYLEHKGEYNIVMGGSFGAMAAFASAVKVLPDELVLCSLSAFFSEDLHHYEFSYLLKKFGAKRVKDLKTIFADHLAQIIKSKSVSVTLVYGELEKAMHPLLVARVRSTAALLGNAKLVELPGAGHKMREQRYIEGLRQVL